MSENVWRFERQITFGVVVAIALQTAGALVWAGATGERLDFLEARIASAGGVNERLARLEEHSAYNRVMLERIERRLNEDE